MSTKLSEIKREHHELDAADQVLGQLASKAALLLVGKNKPYFVRHLDCGDFVDVKNAYKIKVSGKKETQKYYTRFSGYPAGLKRTSLAKMRVTNPGEIIRHAVFGMLPNNKLRDRWIARLEIKAS